MTVGIPSSETSVNGTKRGVEVQIAYDRIENCPLTSASLEQSHELAYSIEHELQGERRKQNAE